MRVARPFAVVSHRRRPPPRYAFLSDMARSYDYAMIETTLKAILAHGFSIQPPRAHFAIRRSSSANAASVTTGEEQIARLVSEASLEAPRTALIESDFEDGIIPELPDGYLPTPFDTHGEKVQRGVAQS